MDWNDAPKIGQVIRFERWSPRYVYGKSPHELALEECDLCEARILAKERDRNGWIYLTTSSNRFPVLQFNPKTGWLANLPADVKNLTIVSND